MYYAIVAALMFTCPLLSVALEAVSHQAPAYAALAGKWFAFWAVGWRLLLAGARQIVQPAYTAKEILGLKGNESLLLVRELGFANLSLGVVGILSILVPAWQLAVALAGGIFYTLAGATHVLQTHRNKLENVAMVSDLFVGLVLLTVCAWSALVR